MKNSIDRLAEMPDGLIGDSLIEYLKTDFAAIPSIISGILSTDSVLMLVADADTGKSTLSAQMAVELTGKNKCFAYFDIPKPQKVMYFITERGYYEMAERIKEMIKEIDFNPNNIMFNTNIQNYDFLDRKDRDEFFAYASSQISTHFNGSIDVVFIDPIYSATSGDLKSGESAQGIIDISNRFRYYYNCSNVLIHHLNKGVVDKETHSRQGKDYYGSTNLRNHCTGSFIITKNNDGTHWKKQKDNYSKLLDHFSLVYQPEECTSHYKDAGTAISEFDRLKLFIDKAVRRKHICTFREIAETNGVSDSYLRQLLSGHHFKKYFKKQKFNGKSTLYHFGEEV